MKTVNIVVPVFNEQESMNRFYTTLGKLTEELNDYSFSYIFVDDGSSDSSLEKIRNLAGLDESVKYISFSRNFGKEAAIYAGLTNSDSDYTILMDADLQHPPELIPEMLKSVDSGEYDACGAKRYSGKMSRLYTKVNNKLTTVKLESGATDYMCMNRKFLNAVTSLCENQRFSKGLFAWVGFRVRWLDYEQGPRLEGESKWNFRKLLAYAMDGITGFSVAPLKMVTYAGGIISMLAIIYILIVLIHTLIRGIDVPGYVTTLVAVLFLGGIILLSVGVLGNYIGRIFIESKNRPIYILNETNIRSGESRSDDEKQITE